MGVSERGYGEGGECGDIGKACEAAEGGETGLIFLCIFASDEAEALSTTHERLRCVGFFL